MILGTYIDPVVIPGNYFVDLEVYLIIFSSMVVKGSSSPPSGVILMPNENKKYLHLNQVAKFAYISFVTQTSNASACLSHSSGLWILDSGASDNLFGNKVFFLPLLLHHFYP